MLNMSSGRQHIVNSCVVQFGVIRLKNLFIIMGVAYSYDMKIEDEATIDTL